MASWAPAPLRWVQPCIPRCAPPRWPLGRKGPSAPGALRVAATHAKDGDSKHEEGAHFTQTSRRARGRWAEWRSRFGRRQRAGRHLTSSTELSPAAAEGRVGLDESFGEGAGGQADGKALLRAQAILLVESVRDEVFHNTALREDTSRRLRRYLIQHEPQRHEGCGPTTPFVKARDIELTIDSLVTFLLIQMGAQLQARHLKSRVFVTKTNTASLLSELVQHLLGSPMLFSPLSAAEYVLALSRFHRGHSDEAPIEKRDTVPDYKDVRKQKYSFHDWFSTLFLESLSSMPLYALSVENVGDTSPREVSGGKGREREDALASRHGVAHGGPAHDPTSPEGAVAAKKTRSRTWSEHFRELLAYKVEHGHVNIGQADSSLGRWCKEQRSRWRSGRLKPERYVQLASVGFAFAPRELRWEKHCQELVSFQREYGHCDIPRVGPHRTLALWLDYQRREYECGKLSATKKEKLDGIGKRWRNRAQLSEWERHYKQLVALKARTGHLHGPYPTDELRRWVYRQRYHNKKGKLSMERWQQLTLLGFSWRGSRGPSA